MSRSLILRASREFPSTEMKYQTAGSSGMDLASVEHVAIEPMMRVIVGTGMKIAIPTGYEGQVRSRSGLALNQGVIVLNSPGTVDSDYRGEIKVVLLNLGAQVFNIEPGDRIAQLVIAPIVHVNVEFVQSLDETCRGEGGFGSTGEK